jgi:hypothetical protein
MSVRVQGFSLGDRLFLQTKYRVSYDTLKRLGRIGMDRAEIERLLDERRKHGLPPDPLWSGPSRA